MWSMIAIVLCGWFGLNAAFVAIRLYMTADRATHSGHDFVHYPRLVPRGSYIDAA
jgi:hypothetical protein